MSCRSCAHNRFAAKIWISSVNVADNKQVLEGFPIVIECFRVHGAVVGFSDVLNDCLVGGFGGNISCVASQNHSQNFGLLVAEFFVFASIEVEKSIIVVCGYI